MNEPILTTCDTDNHASGEYTILLINSGSSTIKFSLYRMNESPTLIFRGEFTSLGNECVTLKIRNILDVSSPVASQAPAAEELAKTFAFAPGQQDSFCDQLIDILATYVPFDNIRAVGHRIVHGNRYTSAQIMASDVILQLKQFMACDPEHLPQALALAEGLTRRYPELTQIACFDTTFHQTLPPVAQRLPIPLRYGQQGVRRYGFHGLSYRFVMQELLRQQDVAAHSGRVIIAHLGSGSSMAAVLAGRCIDTSMAFTPNSGLMMARRSGDIDPGLYPYLAARENLSLEQFQDLINRQSGLLGLSEISSDMAVLLDQETVDTRAADAIESFCYQAKKLIGSYVAVLGGLDTLVFTGGIGENAPTIRSRICSGLDFLGITLDNANTIKNAKVISAPHSAVSVRVIRTNEELVMAQEVASLLNTQ